ncbi:MAG: DNA-directed RNA polymerase subunit omega [Acidimicrobiales bacterium]|jgi:DNA-directed RNA polymerase subunit omega
MAQHVSTLMNPPVEDLLDKVDSKFTLVALASRRARQVNSYYNSLGEGIGVVVPPQVASVSGKPLSIAFEEVAAGKATFTRPDPEEEAALAEAAALAALEEADDVEGEVEGAADTAPVEVEAAVAPVEVAAEVGGEGSDSDSDSDSASGAGSGDAPTE